MNRDLKDKNASYLDSVLHAVELPAGVTHLDSSLTIKIKKILHLPNEMK